MKRAKLGTGTLVPFFFYRKKSKQKKPKLGRPCSFFVGRWVYGIIERPREDKRRTPSVSLKTYQQDFLDFHSKIERQSWDRCRIQNNHKAFRCGATAFGWPNHFFAANKLATPWIFRVSVRLFPKRFKSAFKTRCAHSRLRGFCIAQSLSTSLMPLCPQSDAHPLRVDLSQDQNSTLKLGELSNQLFNPLFSV